MHFSVSLEQFDGPLDLMLHLIKENKLELFDLDMDTLATQYINYIHQVQELHLEVASEYLTELASLLEYKSRKLLPREEVEVEEEYEEDNRQRLVARLLEYQRYKEISAFFKDEYENRQKHFTRPVASLVENWQVLQEDDTLSSQSAYVLMKAMQRVIKRQVLLDPYETTVTIKELSVEERLDQLQLRLKNMNQAMSFEQLCSDCTDTHMVIVTFLAILDLIHQKWLSFTVDDKEMIWLMKGSPNESNESTH